MDFYGVNMKVRLKQDFKLGKMFLPKGTIGTAEIALKWTDQDKKNRFSYDIISWDGFLNPSWNILRLSDENVEPLDQFINKKDMSFCLSKNLKK